MRKILSILVATILIPSFLYAGTATVGRIGKEDLKLWDGTSQKTFERKSRYGGYDVLNKIGYTVDALSVYGGGTEYTCETIANTFSNIGKTAKVGVKLAPGTWIISSTRDFSAYENITLIIPDGAQVRCDANLTLGGPVIARPDAFTDNGGTADLTINGPFEAGNYQVFDWTGSGAVTLDTAKTPTIYSEWWTDNATPGTTDMTSAIEAADACGTVTFAETIYGISDCDLTNPPVFKGYVQFKLLAGASYGIEIEGNFWEKGVTTGGAFFDTGSLAAPANVLVVKTRNWVVAGKIRIDGTAKADGHVGIKLDDSSTHAITHNNFFDVDVRSCGTGILWDIADGTYWYASNNVFSHGYIISNTKGIHYKCNKDAAQYFQNSYLAMYVEASGASNYCITAENALGANISYGVYADRFVGNFDVSSSAKPLHVDGGGYSLSPWMQIITRQDQAITNVASGYDVTANGTVDNIRDHGPLGRQSLAYFQSIFLDSPDGVGDNLGFVIKMDGTAANWARGLRVENSSGTGLCSFDVYGSNDVFNWAYIGPSTSDYYLRTSDHDTRIGGGSPLIYEGTPQTLTGAGAVNLTHAITWIVTTGANALTLADGTEGQRKFIIMKTDVGDGTLTPTNLGNGTTITFDDVGDCADLIFTNGAWHMIGGTATLA